MKNLTYRHDLLKWRREKLGESYDTVAQRTELSKAAVWKIVLGKTDPTATSMTATFRALGLDPKYAMDFKLKPSQFHLAVL